MCSVLIWPKLDKLGGPKQLGKAFGELWAQDTLMVNKPIILDIEVLRFS